MAAPTLHPRMGPCLFTELCDSRPRFTGDPLPAFVPAGMWYWMHSPGCQGGLYRAMSAGPRLFIRRQAKVAA
jgi:hypothetical protein